MVICRVILINKAGEHVHSRRAELIIKLTVGEITATNLATQAVSSTIQNGRVKPLQLHLAADLLV